jgi:hypothetical protein
MPIVKIKGIVLHRIPCQHNVTMAPALAHQGFIGLEYLASLISRTRWLR